VDQAALETLDARPLQHVVIVVSPFPRKGRGSSATLWSVRGDLDDPAVLRLRGTARGLVTDLHQRPDLLATKLGVEGIAADLNALGHVDEGRRRIDIELLPAGNLSWSTPSHSQIVYDLDVIGFGGIAPSSPNTFTSALYG
jgi:hypothetical protein